MVTDSGPTTSSSGAQHYECCTALRSLTPPERKRGTRRHAAEQNGTVVSATHSATLPPPKCGRCPETDPAKFGTRIRRGARHWQPYCKRCAVAYHREWRQGREAKALVAAANRRTRRRYPERSRARKLLEAAVARGDVVRGPCYATGPDCRGQIEGHHDDYSRPLEVIWTCRGHHRALDRTRRQRMARERAA